MLTRIMFLKNGCCSHVSVGNFNFGDHANVDPALAKHLVEEASCAEYVKLHGKEHVEAKVVEQKPEIVQKKVTKRAKEV